MDFPKGWVGMGWTSQRDFCPHIELRRAKAPEYLTLLIKPLLLSLKMGSLSSSPS